MNLNARALLFFTAVFMLAGINTASAAASTSVLAAPAVANATTSANTPKKASGTSRARVKAPAAPSGPQFGATLQVSRSTSLIDFQDGTRSDAMDYLFKPSVKMALGTASATFAYSQDLRDQYTDTASDWSDIPLTFAFKPRSWKWNSAQNARITTSLTGVIPVSKYSVKKDELKTSLSGTIGFSVVPVTDGFNYGISVSAGRNFHAYEEDINGAVLNEYSSNQSLTAGYTYGDWSLSVDFINRARWTYQGNIKSTFELTEELGYSVNDNVSLAVGHTNAGSNLKPNGTDSNIDIYNENNSIVYGTLGLAY